MSSATSFLAVRSVPSVDEYRRCSTRPTTTTRSPLWTDSLSPGSGRLVAPVALPCPCSGLPSVRAPAWPWPRARPSPSLPAHRGGR
jgi:hypothetical protein